MADKTQVYSIGIYTVDGKSDISVFRCPASQSISTVPAPGPTPTPRTSSS